MNTRGDGRNTDEVAVRLRRFNLWTAIIFLVLLVVLALFTELTNRQLRASALAGKIDLNRAIMAKDGAAIREQFDDWKRQLTVLARSIAGRPPASSFVRERLVAAHERNRRYTYAAYRIDRSGRIVNMHPVDRRALGCDISRQRHMRKIIAEQVPVISDTFAAVEGFRAVTIHVPVRSRGEYDGTVAFLVDLDRFARRFLAGSRRFFDRLHLIDQEGRPLHAPPGAGPEGEGPGGEGEKEAAETVTLRHTFALFDKRWTFIDREAKGVLLGGIRERIGNRCIFSRKPNPAPLAAPTWEPEAVRRELRDDLERTRGCVVELVMKDTHTCLNEPERMSDWVRIALEEAEDMGG